METILVGLSNPRTAEHLVHLGVVLAQAKAAKLAIVSVVIVPPGQSLSTAARAARLQRRLLRRAASIAAAEDIIAETLVRAGHTVDEALAEVAVELNADLLLVGSAPTIRFGQPAESPMWRLSQEPPCNLLSVAFTGEHPDFRRILLPIRGGHNAELAAMIAVAIAQSGEGIVTALHVVPSYLPLEEAESESAAFRSAWEGRYPGVVQTRSVIAPSVRECILREAETHDMVILGAAANSRSYPYPFGHLAEEIATRAGRPVLIAKTEQPPLYDDTSLLAPNPVAAPAPVANPSADISVTVDKWFAENTFHSKEFANIAELVRLKEQQNLTISLVLPTLNEEETIGPIISCMQDDLQRRHPLLDELIVMDSRSRDRTVAIARSYGVRVVVHQDLLPEIGSYHGKGEALWKSLSVTTGDIVAWIDTDIANIHAKFVYGLIGPLLKEPRIGYVKGFYRRPLRQGGVLHEASGGRVTELMARPLLNLFYPLLSGLVQPLSGEYAGRRALLEQLPFNTGYGVEIGLLIDILERVGLNAIAQVDLEQRIHRNQSLSALSRMSFAILQTVLRRMEKQQQLELVAEVNRTMKAIVQSRDQLHLDVRQVEEHERPPMVSIHRS